ncbi:SIMPL domain-containing protein [bacterium]|nr:SIMPL domain-containing protein [bacterium]
MYRIEYEEVLKCLNIYDKASFYKEARKLAMEKAHQKASDLAEYGNVKLGEPISIIENRSYDYAVSTANYAMAKMAYDSVEEEASM